LAHVPITVAVTSSIDHLEVVPSVLTLRSTSTFQLHVSGIFANGASVDMTRGVLGTGYQLNVSSVAVVSAEGLITPIGNGVAIVTVTNAGRVATANIRVSFSALAALSINPGQTSIALPIASPAAFRQIIVTGVFSDGTSENLSSLPGTSYQSSNSGVAVAGASGLVTFTQSGQVSITATNSGVSSSSTFTVTRFQSTSLGRLLQSGYTDLAVSGSHVFVTAGSGGLKVIDVSNTLGPSQVASASTSGSMVDIALSGARAFVAETSGLAVFNISNPLAPSRSNTFSGTVSGVAVDGGNVYYSDGSSLKIRNATSLALLGELTGLAAPGSISVSGGLAFAVSASLLYVVDISTPSSPVLMSTVTLPANGYEVTSRGRIAYVASGSVSVVDATVPSQAAIVANIGLGDSRGVAVNDDTLFVADVTFTDQITVFNVSRPEAPVFIDRLPLLGKRESQRVALNNSIAYVIGTAGPLPGLFTALYKPEQPELPPTVTLLTPPASAKVLDGSETPVTAAATDNGAVRQVTYFVDGVAVRVTTAPPYNAAVPIPQGSTGRIIRIGAQAQDYSALLSPVSEVLVESVPDPLTTVQGRLVTIFGDPVPNTPITLVGRVQTTSGPDGSFIVSHVPTWPGFVTLTATAAVSGVPVFADTRRTPVLAGVTEFGDVVMGGGGILTGSFSGGTLNPLMGPFRITLPGLRVNGGGTLTVPAGTILKFDPGADLLIQIGSSLITQGTEQRPVVFTSMADDSVGGDTGRDGLTAGAPGEWMGPSFESAAPATFVSTAIFRFAQSLQIASGSARFENVTISSMSIAAVRLADPNAQITGRDIKAFGNGLNGIDVPPGGFGITSNVTWRDLGLSYVIRNGALQVQTAAGALTILDGVSVKLDGTPTGPGFGRFGSVNSSRPVSILGTAARPVIFTSLKDDSVGGDTNANGAANAPAPGDWHSISIGAPPTITMQNAIFRYGGQFQNGGNTIMVSANSPATSVTDCIFSSGAGVGFQLSSGKATGQGIEVSYNRGASGMQMANAAIGTMTGVNFIGNLGSGVQSDGNTQLYLYGSTFTGNGSYGIDAPNDGGSFPTVVLLATAAFANNGGVVRSHPNADVFVSGAVTMSNTGIQGIDLTGGRDADSAPGSMSRSHQWRKGLPYVIRSNDVLLTSSAQLDLLPGTIVKLRGFPMFNAGSNGSARIRTFNGTGSRLRSLGTPQEPVYITSLFDDTVGGDTNADGFTTSPSTGDWHAIQLSGLTPTFQNTVIRYGGALIGNAPQAMVLISGSQPAIFDVVELSSGGGRGLQLNGSASGQNLLFTNNGEPAALDVINIGVPTSSTFTGVQFLGNRSRGVQTDVNTQLYLYGSTFTANTDYAVEVLNGGSSQPTIVVIATAAFMNNGGVVRAHPNADVLVSGAITMSNTGVQGIDLTGGRDADSGPGSMSRSHQWRKGLPYVIRSNDVLLTSSAQLDLLPGTIVKLRGFPMFNAGSNGSARIRTFNGANTRLRSLGTPQEPVYITSLFDDSVGGDTNADGFTTSPSTGDWHAIQMSGLTPTFQNTVIRYGGALIGNAPQAMVLIAGSQPAIFDAVELSSGGGTGLQLNGTASGQNLIFTNNGAPAALDLINIGTPTSSTFTGVQFVGNRGRGVQADVNAQLYLYGSTFTANADYAVEALNGGSSFPTVVFMATAAFTNNAGVVRAHPNADVLVSGAITMSNTGIQGIDLTGGRDADSAPGSVVRSHQWRKGLPYVIRSNDVLLTSSAQLDLLPGTIVKLRGFPLFNSGSNGSARIRTFNGANSRLRSLGTPQEPVYITSLFDDTVGGDTNGDGFTTSPSTGDWHAIQMSGLTPTFQNTVIRYGGALIGGAPQAMVLISGAQPATFDGVEFRSGGGTGLQLNGTASGQNLLFANNGEPAALDVVNIGVPTSSTFTGVEFAANRGRGVQVDSNGQVYLYNSTFTANAGYGAETLNGGGSQPTVLLLSTAAFVGNAGVVRAHPNSDVLVSGAITMSNTGIQGIDLTGGSDSNTPPGTMFRSHQWTKGMPYVIRGNDMFLMGSAHLQLLPGTVVKLRGSAVGSAGPFSRIRASQSARMSGLGTVADPVYITSLLDDTVGGDTNGDGAVTSPAAGNWHGIQLFGATGSTFQNTVVRYGGANINGNPQQMLATNGSLTLTASQFASAAGAAMRVGAATATITNSQFANNADVGLTLDSNAYAVVNDSSFTGNAEGVQFTSSSGELHNNSFTGNTSFGVRNLTTGFLPIVHAQNNWWGSSSGPTHAGNPGGTGNAVTNGVLYTPFLTSAP